jgi:hypothetical protein
MTEDARRSITLSISQKTYDRLVAMLDEVGDRPTEENIAEMAKSVLVNALQKVTTVERSDDIDLSKFFGPDVECFGLLADERPRRAPREILRRRRGGR